FEGNVPMMRRPVKALKYLFDRHYRSEQKAGNLFLKDDYLARVQEIFSRFNLAEKSCRLIRGYSNNPGIIASLAGERFDVIFIDGDHSYEGVRSDIRHYAPLVRESGYLVMDDASCYLPGRFAYKGREGPSKACDGLPALGFTNVLNVGHDRVYL